MMRRLCRPGCWQARAAAGHLHGDVFLIGVGASVIAGTRLGGWRGEFRGSRRSARPGSVHLVRPGGPSMKARVSVPDICTAGELAITRADVVPGAVGPWDRFCSALGHLGASGGCSVAVITLTSGVVRTKLRSRILNEILAFDMAEFLGHLRQVDAIVVSSFAGPECTIWGVLRGPGRGAGRTGRGAHGAAARRESDPGQAAAAPAPGRRCAARGLPAAGPEP